MSFPKEAQSQLSNHTSPWFYVPLFVVYFINFDYEFGRQEQVTIKKE